jgi:hypothetical protein
VAIRSPPRGGGVTMRRIEAHGRIAHGDSGRCLHAA